MAAPARSCARVHFTADVDILVLREARAINPYEDVSRWAVMSENLPRAIQRNLSPHCLRDRVDLLLAQSAARDRANLRKSGTEEEYNEEQLLAKVYELAKESGYKLKPSSIRKVSATRRQQQQHSKSRRPAADKGIASAVRDLAASEIATESDGTDDGGSMAHEAAACEDDTFVTFHVRFAVQPIHYIYMYSLSGSTNVYDVAEVSAAEPLHNDYEVLAAAPRLDASASVSRSPWRATSPSASFEPSGTPPLAPHLALPLDPPRPYPYPTLSASPVPLQQAPRLQLVYTSTVVCFSKPFIDLHEMACTSHQLLVART
ncbi:hypothetical protein HPB49_026119 [Dermacentor silvarum]|nr:hypothetical protein HPB49_026119 [Dermacentor silvarum]